MTLRIAFSLLAFGLTGCASLHPRAQLKGSSVTFYGESGEVETARKNHEVSLKGTLSTLEENAALAKLAKNVTVLEKTLPPGVEVNGNVISTKPDSGLTVVGTIDVSPARATPLWFSDYQGAGRKVACYWQTPLTWVSLGLWALLVPTSYPCWGTELAVDEGYGLLRASAEAAGADVVVLTEIWKSEEKFFSAKGYLLRSSKKAAPTVPSVRRPDHPAVQIVLVATAPSASPP